MAWVGLGLVAEGAEALGIRSSCRRRVPMPDSA